MAPVGAEPGDAVLAMLLRLFEELQAAGVTVAMVEVLDAAEALRHLDLADRRTVRACLQATLVKHLEDEDVFQALFDRCFPLTRNDPTVPTAAASRQAQPTALPTAAPSEPAATPEAVRADLLAALLQALRDGDEEALRALAAMATDAYAGVGETAGSERYFLYRVLRALDLASLLAAAMRAERGEGAERDELAWRLRRDELARRVDEFRRLLAQEVRHRMHGFDPTAVPVRRLEELDVLAASTVDRRAIREAVRPLARKLAAKVAQRRRIHRLGRLDMRRTARRSLGFGGVPMSPAFRRRKATKPAVVVLCDLSGSMAEFATFTLSLVHALHAELAGLRTFVFVDGVAEVTELLAKAEGELDVVHLLSRTGVVTGDGHSDYGQVFDRFWRTLADDAIGPSTTVIITGDARTNHRPAGVEAFQRLCGRAKRVYWLNPEPAAEWDRDDSVLAAYASTCAAVFEVRTLRQLGDAVAEIVVS